MNVSSYSSTSSFAKFDIVSVLDFVHFIFLFIYLFIYLFIFIIFLIFKFYFIYFLYSRFLSVINFIHISVYMSIPIAQFITPPPRSPCCFPPLVSIHLFSTSVSQFLPCKPVHLYHFSRFQIYALIYDICFSLSDLLHSV